MSIHLRPRCTPSVGRTSQRLRRRFNGGWWTSAYHLDNGWSHFCQTCDRRFKINTVARSDVWHKSPTAFQLLMGADFRWVYTFTGCRLSGSIRSTRFPMLEFGSPPILHSTESSRELIPNIFEGLRSATEFIVAILWVFTPTVTSIISRPVATGSHKTWTRTPLL